MKGNGRISCRGRNIAFQWHIAALEWTFAVNTTEIEIGLASASSKRLACCGMKGNGRVWEMTLQQINDVSHNNEIHNRTDCYGTL